jgi:hypothetical protein
MSKPLPPLPLLVTKPQQNAQHEQSRQQPTEQQLNEHQPTDHFSSRPLRPVASDSPPGTYRLEAKLEREYIERQREKTLWRLESRK